MNNPIEQSCIGQKIVTFPRSPRTEFEKKKNFPRGVHKKQTKSQYPRYINLPEYYDETNFITQILSSVEQPCDEVHRKQYEQNVIEYYWEVFI